MEHKVQKISMLLNIFQASLFDHMITLAKNNSSAEVYIGRVPETLLEHQIKEESKEVSKNDSENEELGDSEQAHHLPMPEVQLRIQKHGKLVKGLKACQSHGLGEKGFETCRGVRKPHSEVEVFELVFEEAGQVRKNLSAGKPKVLQRLGRAEAKPARYVIPQEGNEEKEEVTQADLRVPSQSLYGEAIATTYSQGGDGFCLHPGDLVTILQFFHEFQLVECKWQGLKGLFPQDKLRVLSRPSDSLNSSLSSIISKQFVQSKAAPFESLYLSKGSKLMNRLMKKAV